jgi:hypothetical protein
MSALVAGMTCLAAWIGQAANSVSTELIPDYLPATVGFDAQVPYSADANSEILVQVFDAGTWNWRGDGGPVPVSAGSGTTTVQVGYWGGPLVEGQKYDIQVILQAPGGTPAYDVKTHTVTAGDPPPPEPTTLTMDVFPVGAGTTVPAVGVHSVDTNTIIDVTATPAADHYFSHWQVTSGEATVRNPTSAASDIRITDNEGATLVANFQPESGLPYFVSADLAPNYIPVASGDAAIGAIYETSTDARLYVMLFEQGTFNWAGDGLINVAAGSKGAVYVNLWHPELVDGAKYDLQISLRHPTDVNVIYAATSKVITAGDPPPPAATSLYMAVSPAGAGTTVPAEGVSHDVQSQIPVNISATASAGRYFTGWTVFSGNASIANPSSPNTTVTVNDEGGAAIQANFGTDSSEDYYVSTELYPQYIPAAEGNATINVIYETSTNADLWIILFEKGTFNWAGDGLATVTAGSKGVRGVEIWHPALVPGAEYDMQVTLRESGNINVTYVGDSKVVIAGDEPSGTDAILTMDAVGGGTTIPAVGTHTVTVGEPVGIVAVEGAGVSFVNWEVITGNATIANANAIQTTVTVNAAAGATVRANFASVDTATLTMAVAPGGSGTTTPAIGAHTVNVGAATAISATPVAGFNFVNWTVTAGNATIADANSASTTATVNNVGGATIQANFVAIETATLTMAAAPGGSGTTTPAIGAHTVNVGEATAISATPIGAFHFVNWTVTAGNATIADANSASTTVTVNDAGGATIQANFSDEVIETATLTMAASPGGSGTTSPAIGAHTVNVGAATAIVATPAAGFQFVNWTVTVGSGTIADANATTTTVTVDGLGGATVQANFTAETTLTIAVTPVDGGTTTPDVGGHSVGVGVPVAIVADAADGFAFQQWLGDANAVIANANAASTTVTLSGSATVTAVFAELELIACGSQFAIGNDEVGLAPAQFNAKPKAYAIYTDPVKLIPGKKATAKVLTKVSAKLPVDTIDCGWTKKIRLFNKALLAAQNKAGKDTATWLSDNPTQNQPLALPLRASSKQIPDQAVRTLSLAPPTVDVVEVKAATIEVTGQFFGTKKPKVWMEYLVPGKGI